MEGFRNFVAQSASNIWGWLTGWLQRIKSNILISAKPKQDGVGFRLSSPTSIAEAWDNVKKMQSITRQMDPQGAWTGRQTAQFQKSFSANLRHIASVLGFLFEVEVVLYLVSKGLKLDGEDLPTVQQKQKDYHAKVQQHLGQFAFSQFMTYIGQNAAEVGDAMIDRTKAMVNCNPRVVHYMPQFSVDEDIILSCRDDVVNWSMKYTSEALVKLRTFNLNSAYSIMGGNPAELASLGSEIAAAPESGFSIILDKFWGTMEETGWTQDPNNMAKLITYLLRGDERTLFAIKNYVKGTSVVGDASEALQKDFNIRRTANGIMFSAKPGAVVSAVRTADYIKLKYQLPGGAGTYVMMRLRVKPSQDMNIPIQMQFYMNNLA